MTYDSGQLVRLKCDVPNLDLHVGQIGVVCTRWFEPMRFYELEFQSPSNHAKVHVVLEEQQFDPMEPPNDGDWS
jgi:hypothetical protein